MKKILLTKNQFSIVDDEDFDKVNKHKWCSSFNRYTRCYVALRALPKEDGGKKQMLLMHRFILNAPKGIMVDHINHNSLDNRKINLRLCTNSQNQMNVLKHKKSLSGYKGVSLNKETMKWISKIVFNKKTINLGYFIDKIDAAKAYNEKAKELFGEFACFSNFKFNKICGFFVCF